MPSQATKPAKRKLRTGDTVIVIAGKHKDAVSTIEKIQDDKVRLKDVNVVKKAVKKQGFVKKTLPIHISNVMYYLADKKQAVKIRIERKDGKKQRIAKKLDTVLK